MQELRNRGVPDTAVEEWLPEGVPAPEPTGTNTGEWVAADVVSDWVGESVPEDWVAEDEPDETPGEAIEEPSGFESPEPDEEQPEVAGPEATEPEPQGAEPAEDELAAEEPDAFEPSEFLPPPPPEPDPEAEALREELARVEQRAAAAEERARSLEDRLHRQEALTEDARRTASAERLEAALAASPPAADGRLDLNAATFEALRALGLSVNQAARFIGQRDERGGFRSMDDLDGLYGLPSDVLRSLYEHGAV